MSLELIIPAGAVLFVVLVAARPLWDIRHQLWTTLDWRDLATLGLAVLAVLLPIAVLVSALPFVSWFENVIPKSVVPDEPSLVSGDINFGRNVNNLGELYRSQGRYVEAEAYFKHALAVVEKEFGLTNPDASLPL